MGGRETPLTIVMIDSLGATRRQVAKMVRADGRVTPAEAEIEAMFDGLKDIAEQIDEARLNAISYLDHGQLRPRRRRRMREIGAPVAAG